VLCWELPHHVERAGFVEGTVLAAYEYRASRPARRRTARIEELVVSATTTRRRGRARRGRRRGRQRVPRPAERARNEMTPTRLAERAHARARRATEVWGRAEIEAAGMGAFAAVARGSDEEPS
jgi:leucyl aminopeptidase